MDHWYLFALLLVTAVVSTHAHGLRFRDRGYKPPRHHTFKHGSFYKPLPVKYGPPQSSYKPSSSYESFSSYEKPKYESASYDVHSYQPPPMKVPSYETPSYETPSYETPSYETPSYETPSYEAPSSPPEMEMKHEVTYEKPVDPPKPIRYKPSGECTYRGQYLRDAANKCKFRRCVVQSEPWEEEYGIPLDIISQYCAPGTAVPDGYHEGDANPCTIPDETCIPEKPVHKPPPPVEKPTYPPPHTYVTPAPPLVCKARGMYLPDPDNKCRYQRCVVQTEPWEQDGEIPLDKVSLPCAPGTAVPAEYMGGYKVPCTALDDTCGAVPKSYSPPEEAYPAPEEPSYEAPAPEEPSYEDPAPAEPSYEAPAPEEPSYEAPQPMEPEYQPMTYEPAPVVETEPKHMPITYKPHPECLSRGMYLPHPETKCKFRQCVVQTEPWEENGEIPLDIISADCARGSAVPAEYTGGYGNPCTAFDSTCGVPVVMAPAETPSYAPYPEPEPPTLEEPEVPADDEPKGPSYMEPEAPSNEEPVEPSYEEPEEPSDMEPEESSFEAPVYIEPEAEEENEVSNLYRPMAKFLRFFRRNERSMKHFYHNECSHSGQLLADPEDKCKFRRCVANGESLEGVPELCAPGTAVPPRYKGGYINPCTLPDATCGAPVKSKIIGYH